MKQLFYIAALALIPVAVFAQSSLDEEVGAELDKLYAQTKATSQKAEDNKNSPAVQVNVQAQPQAHATQVTGVETAQVSNPVMSQGQVQVQKQPVTFIEASPLSESRAEKIRKARQESELQTEQKIVEVLEQSRMEDEKKRADVLFGDKFNQMNNNQSGGVAVGPIVVQEKVVAPMAPPAEVMDRTAVRQEVTAALAEMQEKTKPVEKKTYFSALGGMGDYPDVANVRGNYAAGFAIGQKFNDRLMVEGSFLYSNYSVEQRDNYYDPMTGWWYPRVTEMQQYNTSLDVKYQLLGGMFRPVIGGIMSYNYRTFADTQFALWNNEAASHALDMGLLAGADFELGESFALGLDFRYMWNLTSRVANKSGYQRSFSESVYSQGTAIEKLSYMNISVVGRVNF
ncbi:MAG: hypothetical protein BroJett040_15150 [Oligoflexia bacterium]|nr:MAG: hypothetical protein BroJett040_15150 [Oligoflexia bacterium]